MNEQTFKEYLFYCTASDLKETYIMLIKKIKNGKTLKRINKRLIELKNILKEKEFLKTEILRR